MITVRVKSGSMGAGKTAVMGEASDPGSICRLTIVERADVIGQFCRPLESDSICPPGAGFIFSGHLSPYDPITLCASTALLRPHPSSRPQSPRDERRTTCR